MPAFAQRLGRASVAATVQMSQRARELRGRGSDVISLAIGEPDFASPRHAIEAAYQAALRGETKYPPQDGMPALKEAVRRKFLRDNHLDFASDEIIVSNGGKQAIHSALVATLDDGELARLIFHHNGQGRQHVEHGVDPALCQRHKRHSRERAGLSGETSTLCPTAKLFVSGSRLSNPLPPPAGGRGKGEGGR